MDTDGDRDYRDKNKAKRERNMAEIETEGEKGTSSGPQIPLTPPLLQFFPLALEKKETQLPPPLKGW